MRRPDPQPFHEPVGFSDEEFPVSRHWLALFIAALVVAALGTLGALANLS